MRSFSGKVLEEVMDGLHELGVAAMKMLDDSIEEAVNKLPNGGLGQENSAVSEGI